MSKQDFQLIGLTILTAAVLVVAFSVMFYVATKN